MKFEWKKQERELYLPKNKPEIVSVPKLKFFMLDGKGNPNDQEFSDAIGALYSLAYAVKMLPKKGVIPEGYFDYTVYPLEGVWNLAKEAQAREILDKNSLIYTIMIREPDFVTNELAAKIIKSLKIKKPHALLDNVKFDSLEEGLCLQMLHIGSYDEEPKTFSIMEDYCTQNNVKRTTKTHREIYISDARKTQPDKLKTVLRFQVEHTQ
ncbi:MAG: GyrI-like domain-containing protein [Desulfosporosinus sp.]|nr:GyrI-like domain-containing protein [Desulfosporosinus sp.]